LNIYIDYITCGLGKDHLEKAYLLFPDLHNISAANKLRGDALTIPMYVSPQLSARRLASIKEGCHLLQTRCYL